MTVDRRPNQVVYEPGAPCGEYLAFWLMEEVLACPKHSPRLGIGHPRKATRRAGSNSGLPRRSGVVEVTLGRVAFRCRVYLLPAIHHYRVHQRHDPDHHDQGVEEHGRRTLDPDSLKKGLHVDDEDEATDSGAHDPSGQDTNDPGRYRRRDNSADQQRSDQLPGDIGEAQGDEEPSAGSEGHDELTGVYSAYYLARLHPPGGEEGGRGDGPPAATTRRVEKPRHETQRAKKRFGDGPLPYRPLMPPERKSREDKDTEAEQEHRDDRLGDLSCKYRSQYHGAEEGSYGPRYGKPDDPGPVHVAEAPVRDPRRSAGPHLCDVYARGSERRRDPDRQEQRRRGHPVGHP